MSARSLRSRWWTQPIKLAAQRFGYQISRIRPPEPDFGTDAFHDMRVMLSDVSRPVVFDVGANTGQSVVRFSEILFPCEIHSFEPSPTTFETLQSNVGGFPGVHLSNLGVGATIGQSTLIEIDRPDQSSFLAPAEAAYGEVVAHTQVQVTTLDEYCRTAGIDYIDILKTDTQGFELEVLRGAAGLIAEQRINLLHMEVIFASIYEDIPPFDAVYRFLLDHGFELVGFYQLEFVNQRAGWCDCLAVNPSFVRCSS